MNADFLEGARGPLFYILHLPTIEPVRGCVLYVHPFAEELNKSRRMAALQARRFAAAGYAVLMPDLYGCGDSAGDFGEADWNGWSDDLRICLTWLRDRYPGPVIPWGLRTGCLLLSALFGTRAAARSAGGSSADPDPENFSPAATVFWQPVVDGEKFLIQFLRLRMAAGMIGGNRENTQELRARLEAGEMLEVAGYDLSPRLAAGLATARLNPPPGGPVHWLEVTTNAEGGLPLASRKTIEAWTAHGLDVHAAACVGAPFWSTQEITEAPALLDQTLARLAGND